jgi:hypothetical protein
MLHGEDAPVAKPDCVRATARRFALDPDPFEKIFAFRSSSYLPPGEKEANDIFAAYMMQLDRVIQVVDEFDRTQNQEN